MTQILELPRTLCALGAQQTVLAIEHAIPILHAGPGCGHKLTCGLGYYNGYQGSGYAGGSAIVSTNVGEQEIVFGGEKRLADVIEGALKVMDGDLYVVLSGCSTELVGDDVDQVVNDFRDRGVTIVRAKTGGFRGNNILGHETVVNSIIQGVTKPTDVVVKGLVNVFASVPYQDTFWAGNLSAIKALLESIGLQVNILFGQGSGGVSAWKRIPSAQFNLVVSSWVGVSTARKLQEEYGTPWLHIPHLPIGGFQTSQFLRTVGQFAGIDSQIVEIAIAKHEAEYFYYYERSADFFLECRWDLPSRFVTIADSSLGIGIAKFLVSEIGLLPSRQFATDTPPDEFRENIAREYAELAPSIGSETTFTNDTGDIREKLIEEGVAGPLVLGSVWDRDVARELGGCHLSIVPPMTDRLVIAGAYAGYHGGLRLLEDIYSNILTSIQ